MSKRALLFPGQGSQSVGMLNAYLESHGDIVRSTLDQADQALGYSLSEVVDSDHDDVLNQTEYTQPALLASSVAIFRILQSHNVSYDYVAGHSLGEYSALVAVGALDFAEALDLVRTRGRLMQKAVPAGEGRMAAILGGSTEAIESLCRSISTDAKSVQAANYNSPKQIVISGHGAAVEEFIEKIETTGAKRAVPLRVGVPSHSRLMQPAADQFAGYLRSITLKTPAKPILPNVDARPTSDVEHIRGCLLRQLSAPVRWVQTIEKLISLSVTRYVECGPGKVLAGLQAQISREHLCQPLSKLIS